MYALYAFARITDDLGDGALGAGESGDDHQVRGNGSVADLAVESKRSAGEVQPLRELQLFAWENHLAQALKLDLPPRTMRVSPFECSAHEGPPEAGSAHAGSAHAAALAQADSRSAANSANSANLANSAIAGYAPLWPALVHAVDQFAIPPQLLLDIVEGVRMDLRPQPPANWDELRHYCYHVASAVGLACVHIWRSDPGGASDLPMQSAIDCGIAFQLTNILRDIAEDARVGRSYIPLTEMERFDVDPGRWLAGEPTGNWPALIEHMAAEAERLYVSGWPTIEALTPRSQRMFSLMWRSYRQLLREVVAQKTNLWSEGRVRLSTSTKLNLLTSHLVPQLFRRLPTPEPLADGS